MLLNLLCLFALNVFVILGPQIYPTYKIYSIYIILYCVYACVRACVCMCVRACVCVPKITIIYSTLIISIF